MDPAHQYANYDVFKNEQLELNPWFWPDASRQSAEEALGKLEQGFFLVRPSSQKNSMALSHVVKSGENNQPSKVGHALIVKKGDVVTLEATDKAFSSIEHLVGMLNLQAAPLSPQQKEALDKRRRDAAMQRSKAQEQAQARIVEARRQRELEQRQREERMNRQRQERERKRKLEEESREEVVRRKREKLSATPDLQQRVTKRVDDYVNAGRFERAEIATLQEAFGEIDESGLGGFAIEDIANVMDGMGEAITQQELLQFMAEIDADRNGIVTFDEFLDAVDKLGDELELGNEQALRPQMSTRGAVSPRRGTVGGGGGTLRPSMPKKQQGGIISPVQ